MIRHARVTGPITERRADAVEVDGGARWTFAPVPLAPTFRQALGRLWLAWIW